MKRGRIKPKPKRINQQSDANKQQIVAYTKIRAIWLGGRCEARFDGCQRNATEIQHRQARSVAPALILRIENFAAVCRNCHHLMTDIPEWIREAKRLGLVERSGTPMETKTDTICRKCGRPIYWAHIGNRSVPLDADPHTGMPLDFEDNGAAGRIQERWKEYGMFDDDGLKADPSIHVKVLKNGEDADPGLAIWSNHHDSCPHQK